MQRRGVNIRFFSWLCFLNYQSTSSPGVISSVEVSIDAANPRSMAVSQSDSSGVS